MAFTYNPTDVIGDENNEARYEPLAPGLYEVVLFDVAEKESKSSGAPMLELILDVYDKGKKRARVWDFFVSPHKGKKGTLWKMGQMADCMGPDFVSLVKAGEFQPADYTDCRFQVELEVDGDFNRVKKWVKLLSDVDAQKRKPREPAALDPEEIPF